MKKRILISIVLSIITFCLWAEDISVVIPTTKDTNYVLYPVSTGVFLRLDTRDGTIIGIAPTKSEKSRILNSNPLASDNKTGRFQLYPTENSWEWILFDTTTGEVWLLRWSAKKDVLTKINIEI
ncbi:hypothetical protein [uncultured Prevotella sp.]|uniref:hypothetical protein n=1 Tax=uncultured Prevotella sp. TaxID=159272 RepID=UPI0027DBF873|nr:hypothetical protein [uncultured Prevotella sp.]